MKRSEKEVEVRRLLETPNTFVLLPKDISVAQATSFPVDELVNRLMCEATPRGGWEPEGLPRRLQVKQSLGPYIVPVGRPWNGADDQTEGLQAAVDAYNDMKEAEEVEADPNDPLTVGLERLAAEEIATLIADAAKVTHEETIRQLTEKCVSKYTREEFVAAEMQAGIDAQGVPGVDFEDLDPYAERALRRRAEWNAQAAERAGVVWKTEDSSIKADLNDAVKRATMWYKETRTKTADLISAKVACRNCGGYEWPEKISDYGECRKCVSQRLEQEDADMESVATGGTDSTAHFVEDAETRSMNRVRVLERQKAVPATSNQAWIHYCDDGLYIHHTIPRETFNAGWDYGYQAGWRARMDTLNPVCSPEAVDETLATDSLLDGLEPTPGIGDAPAAHRDMQALARVVARQHDRISTIENRLADALAAIDEINRQFGDEVRWRRDVDRIEGKVEAAAAVSSRVESEWKIQGQKYTADLRRVSHVNGELVRRVVVLEADNATDKDSLRELRDLGQRTFDRLDQQKVSLAQLAKEVSELSKATALNSNQHSAEIIRLRQEIDNLEANLQGLMDAIGKLSGRINRLEAEIDAKGEPT